MSEVRQDIPCGGTRFLPLSVSAPWIKVFITFDGSPDARPFDVLMDDILFKYAEVLSGAIKRQDTLADEERRLLKQLKEHCLKDLDFLRQLRTNVIRDCVKTRSEKFETEKARLCNELFDIYNFEWQDHKEKCQRVLELP